MEFYESPKPWTPRSYMRKAVKFLVEHGAAGLLLDPGLGKTSVTLAAIKFLRSRGVIGRVLIIAPLRVCYLVWPKEVQKWIDFRDLRVEILHGPDKDAALLRDADLYVINPDGLEWLLSDPTKLKRLAPDVLVIDELTKFKHTRTRRFKLLKKVLGKFKRRWGLTGSPASNGLLDLFGQAYVLDLGLSLGRFVTHYKIQYFRLKHPGSFEWVLQEGAEERIYERLAPLVLRMSAEDHIDVPKLVEVNVRVELPTEARRIYDELHDDLIARIESGEIVAANAATASGKCRQVASGAIYVDELPGQTVMDGRRSHAWLHDTKVDALEELIEELQGQPLLVAYEFRHDLERILARLGPETPTIGGGMTMKNARAVEAAWNRGEIPVLLVHPQAAGHGLNLQGASARHVAWFTLTWDYELYDQLIRRLRRQGSEASSVTSHRIIATGTVDEAVAATLGRKRRGQDSLFKALKRMGRS